MRKTIFVDFNKCMSCLSCTLACAVEHSDSKNLQGALNQKGSKPVSRIFLERLGKENKDGMQISLSFPISCRHCEDAPCIKSCPSKALFRENENSPVVLTEEKCIGCKFCIMACPFGVIKTDLQTKKMKKCDLCIDRQKAGKIPACVEVCPSGCLKFEEEEDYSVEKRRKYMVETVSGEKKQHGK